MGWESLAGGLLAPTCGHLRLDRRLPVGYEDHGHLWRFTMTKTTKVEWQTPRLTTIGKVSEVTLAQNIVGGGDSQFSVLLGS